MPGRDDDIIDSAVVRIGPDLTGFRAKLIKDVEKATKGLTFKVKVVADGVGLRESVRGEVRKQMALSRQPVYKVKVVADATGLKRQVERELKSIGGLNLGGGRGGGGRGDRDAEREARNAEREAKKAEDEHYRRVRTNLEKVEQAEEQAMYTRYRRSRDFQERVAGDELAAYREKARRSKAADEEKIASQNSVTRAAEKAAAEQTRLAEKAAREQERIDKDSVARRKKTFDDLSKSPQLIDYGGKGIKPMNLLYGVVTAMTPALFAMGASALQASTSIAALGSAGIGAALGLSGVLVAFQGIGDLLSLRKQVLNENTTGAANAARTAALSADDLAQAKRSLADANRDEASAEADLHKARRQAVQDLDDLKQAVIDLDNQYKSDTLSVAEARETAQATDRNFFASALERARAWQDVRDAETRLKDTTLQRKQKKQDLKESLAGGIEKSDRVQQARERVRDARDRRLDAQAALRKQSASTAAGIDKVSSASAQLKKKLAELSPAAREMYYWFERNEGLFKRLQNQIAQQVLPGFTRFLKAITAAPKGGKSTLQLAAEYAGELGAVISKYAGLFGEWTKTPLFRSSMARIQERNARAFDNLGQALLTLADPITRILDKASPGFESLSEILLDLAESFDKWIEQLDKSGGLEKWFKDARTELGKWWDILVNVGELFKNIFTAALPAGSSLVTSFRDFTQSLVDWSDSPDGQKALKDFFEGFRDLPYAKIADFFKNAGTFFVAFRTFALLKSLNPFMLAIGAFAAANPQLAAQAFATIADKLAWVMQQIVAHPDAAATLLAIFAAAKLGKAIGFDIKIPVVNSLRDALVSKFKVLDKFVGGGATTGTMNVQAGVVNVYGKTISGGPTPGIDVDPTTGKPRKGSKILAGVEAIGVSNVVSAAVLFGATTGWQEFQRGLGKDKRAFAAWKDIFKDGLDLGNIWNTFIDNSAVTMLTVMARKWGPAVGRFFSMTLPNLLSGKTNGWAGVGTYLLEQLSMYGGDGILGGIIDGLTGNAYTEFKNKISGWVDGVIDWFKKCFGIASPSTIFAEIGADLVAGLWSGFVAKWEELRKTVPAWINENITTPLKDTFTAAGNLAAAGFAFGFATLTKKLAEPAAAVLAWLDTHFINKINALLRTLGAPIIPTLTGGSVKDVGKGVGKIIGDVAQKVKRSADGGLIGGHSPHDRADNIPAMLTAKEYVQPVSAVKYYGTDFMEAVRTRRFPRYAKGGLVGALTGKLGKNLLTDIAGAAIKRAGGSVAAAAAQLSPPPGVVGPSGPGFTGKVPRGVGAIRGVNARMAAAAIDVNRAMGAHVFSGLRVGSKTRTGNPSYHRYGRAIDLIPPSMQLFNYLKAKYGKFAREIIYTPAGGNQIWNGHEHVYRDPRTRADHYNHVHLALAKGGLVQARKYDRGGVLPPGFTTVYNGTGRNETVRTDKQEKALATPLATRLDRRDLALLAQYMANSIGSPAITMDGRRVAETTNRYNYLPAGV